MIMRLFIAGTAVAGWTTAASAADASLTLSSNSPTNATFTYTDYVGPIAAIQTNRGGKFSGSADYGQVSAARSGTVTSRVDAKTSRSASGNARWDDVVTVATSTGEYVRAAFRVDVALPNIQLSTSGYGTSTADAGFAWSVGFDTAAGSLSGVANGAKFYTDTPLTTPLYKTALFANSSGFDSGALYGVGASVKSLGTLRTGFQSYEVSAGFRPGTYHFFGAVGCYVFQTSFRVGDSASANCGTGTLEWGGLTGVTKYYGTPTTATVSFEGASGYDYTQPFSQPAAFGNAGAGVAAVPEPASWALMIAGFGLVGAMARRRSVAVAA